ncbi:MAG TPA: hypothetical protein VK983_01245, partial [Candidatus Limnocylindrales bacterium]|nr:hypothetical protein [Candidatus Limnocylindrales bacterium]
MGKVQRFFTWFLKTHVLGCRLADLGMSGALSSLFLTGNCTSVYMSVILVFLYGQKRGLSN